MQTLFIGGGQGCREVVTLVEQGRLAFLGIEVMGVVDIDPEAPALAYARDRGWATFAHLEDGLALPGLQLVIELTGSARVLDEVHRSCPPGVRIIDHVVARVFWDLDKVSGDLRQELEAKTELQAQALRSRQRLGHILDAISELIVVLDKEARILHVNQTFERTTGTTRDRVRGIQVRDVFEGTPEEEWADDFTLLLEDVLSNGHPMRIVRTRSVGEEEERTYQVSADPIFDEDLEISRVVISARDITEQGRLERETEESARQFQQIMGAVHEIVAIKDLDGRYIHVNPWTEKITGLTREEIIGKTAEELFPRKAAEIIHDRDRTTLEKGELHVSEEELTLGGEERVFVSERLPLRDYTGEVVGLCCVSQDQTRRRRLQDELVQSERLAAIGKLSAGVAHEINNPLSGILTFAQDLLLESAPDDPRRQDYEIIVNETLRCRRIVRDLLEFSRQKSPKREPIEVGDLIGRVLPMVERQASFQNVEFEVTLAQDVPPLLVDPQQVQQVLLNLVINARDAMQEQGTIRIDAEPSDDGRSVVLSVRDEGDGIPEDQLPEIFEPFHSSKGEHGTGLGLVAVLSVVERHKGRISVESEVGIGTTFRIFLPAAQVRP